MQAVEIHYRKSITMANTYKEQGCNDLSKYDEDVLTSTLTPQQI